MDNSYLVLKVSFSYYALRKKWWQQHHHHHHYCCYCYYYYFVEVWPVLGPWAPCCWDSEITEFSQHKGASPMFNIQRGQPSSLCPVPCSKPVQHRWPYQQLSCHWHRLRNNATFHCSNNVQMQGILFYQYKTHCSLTGNNDTYEDFKPILFVQIFLPLKNLKNW